MPLTSDLRQSDQIRGRVDEHALTFDARELLDASATVRTAVIDKIRKACMETGFFYLDHAFDNTTVVDGVLRQMRKFFELADDDPRKQAVYNNHNAGTYGWMPMFAEPAPTNNNVCSFSLPPVNRKAAIIPARVMPAVPCMSSLNVHVWLLYRRNRAIALSVAKSSN